MERGRVMDSKTLEKISFNITSSITGMLESLIHEHGFQLPLHMACISPNGSLIAYSFTTDPSGENPEPQAVAEFFPDERGMNFPIHFLWVDSTGRAMRAQIKEPDADALIEH